MEKFKMVEIDYIKNISNEGFPLASGDTMLIVYKNGNTEEKTFYSNEDIPEPEDSRLPVVITSVTGEGLVKLSDDKTQVWVLAGADVLVEFTLEVPDTTFFLTAKQAGGVEAMFVVSVKNGVGKVKLNFDVMGQYWITDKEINRDIKPEQFKITPIRIDVAKG